MAKFVYHSMMPVSPNIRASIYMVLSMLGFTINDLIIKSMDNALPPGQVMWLRGWLLTGIIILLAWQRGILHRWTEALTKLVLIRSVGEACATVLFLTALAQLPYANITAILQSLPLAVTLGAVLFFAEAVGWRRWIAIVIGFIGVLIIIRPGMAGFHPASGLVLLSVVFAAVRDLVTRQLPDTLPSLLVAGMASAIIGLLGLAMTTVQGNWHPVSLHHWFSLATAAGFLFFGYQFIILSMRTGDVAYVVPYRYSSLLWAVLFGYWFFGEVPDGYTIIGSLIVVATGLFTLYRELAVARQHRRRGSRPAL